MTGRKQGQTSEPIALEIKRRILEWAYPPQHPLVEEALAREFAVSRSPVREALRMLEADGFVRRIPNRGYHVLQVKPGEVADLYEVRLALELFALEKLAAMPQHHEEIRRLAQVWDAVPGKEADAEAMAKQDQTYHEALVALAGNAKLLEVLRRINERLWVLRVIGFEQALEQDSLKTSFAIHRDLTRAILSGDPAAIRSQLERNISQGRGNVEQAMGKVLAKAYMRQTRPSTQDT